MDDNKKYNNVDYIKNNMKEGCSIYFEYSYSFCGVSFETVNKYNCYPIHYECDTYGYEMISLNFDNIENFFENATIDNEKIKNIWKEVEIIRVEGF